MERSETQTREREMKFEAPAGLALPDLRDLVGRTERLPHQHLRTAYFDTAEGRLWDRGITLRHRITDDDVGHGTWTLKLPHAADGTTLERTELSWSGGPAEIPRHVDEIVRGLIRREPIQLLVELDTTRQRLALHDHNDRVLAEIDDDSVVVAGGPRDGLRFRQVELELHADETSITRRVAARLEEAGLAVEDSPKLAKALGLPTSHPGGPPARRGSLADVVRAAIDDGLDRLLEHDWRLRLALPEAAHDVHQARVAVRRLRSHLKTFRAVLDPVWVRHVRNDLKWAGVALGELRDDDVLAAHLEGAPAQLGDELARQHDGAAHRVTMVLASDRYLDLLDRLHAATRTPPFVDHDAMRPDDAARDALPELVGARWRTLRRQARKGGADPSDQQLHRIRIDARHLRFAAELAVPIVGKPARQTAAAAEKVQAVLGEHHDAVTAEAWLWRQVDRARTAGQSNSLSPATWFEAGRLSGELRQRQSRYRRRWPRAWKALATSKRRRWLR